MLKPILGCRARIVLKRHLLYGWLWPKLVDTVTCVSEAARRSLLEEFRLSSGKTTVVLNGVDGHYFCPAERPSTLKRELGIATSDRLLLDVGRLAPEKRVDVLLEALLRLRQEGERITCLIAGEGGEEQKLRHQAEKSGVAPYVRFLGFHRDLRPYYRGADLLVLPSRTEGLPTVLLEAMACGVPCVATRVGGVPEVITDGVDGWLVEAGSAGALAEGIRKALAQGGWLKEYGARGRINVVEQFNVEKQARELARTLFGEWAVVQR